jgi:hypothetical protein
MEGCRCCWRKRGTNQSVCTYLTSSLRRRATREYVCLCRCVHVGYCFSISFHTAPMLCHSLFDNIVHCTRIDIGLCLVRKIFVVSVVVFFGRISFQKLAAGVPKGFVGIMDSRNKRAWPPYVCSHVLRNVDELLKEHLAATLLLVPPDSSALSRTTAFFLFDVVWHWESWRFGSKKAKQTQEKRPNNRIAQEERVRIWRYVEI